MWLKRAKLLKDLMHKGLSDHSLATALGALERYGDPKDHEAMEQQAARLLELVEPLETEEEIVKVLEAF